MERTRLDKNNPEMKGLFDKLGLNGRVIVMAYDGLLTPERVRELSIDLKKEEQALNNRIILDFSNVKYIDPEEGSRTIDQARHKCGIAVDELIVDDSLYDGIGFFVIIEPKDDKDKKIFDIFKTFLQSSKDNTIITATNLPTALIEGRKEILRNLARAYQYNPSTHFRPCAAYSECNQKNVDELMSGKLWEILENNANHGFIKGAKIISTNTNKLYEQGLLDNSAGGRYSTDIKKSKGCLRELCEYSESIGLQVYLYIGEFPSASIIVDF